MGRLITNGAMSVKHFLIMPLLFSLTVLFSCDSKPDHKTEQAWQQSFREALIDGYTDFRGHFVDTDASVYIFSYQSPPELAAKDIFSILRKQIRGYNATSESNDELVLQRLGTSQRHEAFDEYRFLISDSKVTVMFASLDSPAEIKNHRYFIEKFQKAHNALLASSSRR